MPKTATLKLSQLSIADAIALQARLQAVRAAVMLQKKAAFLSMRLAVSCEVFYQGNTG